MSIRCTEEGKTCLPSAPDCCAAALLAPLLLLLPGISKALESSYTRVLAEQLNESGIMVNCCCPG
jgi:short-subunit dehydrogenase